MGRGTGENVKTSAVDILFGSTGARGRNPEEATEYAGSSQLRLGSDFKGVVLNPDTVSVGEEWIEEDFWCGTEMWMARGTFPDAWKSRSVGSMQPAFTRTIQLSSAIQKLGPLQAVHLQALEDSRNGKGPILQVDIMTAQISPIKENQEYALASALAAVEELAPQSGKWIHSQVSDNMSGYNLVYITEDGKEILGFAATDRVLPWVHQL